MAPRIRTLKPTIWRDKAFCSVSRDARLLFIGLISNADDEGRFEADAELVRAAVYPRDGFGATPASQLFGSVGDADLDVWLGELEAAGLIRLWTIAGERFGDLPGWVNHQRIKRPTLSTLPTIHNQDKNRLSSTNSKDANAIEVEAAPEIPGISDTLPPHVPHMFPPEREEEKDKDLSGSVATQPHPHSTKRSSVKRGDGMKVWNAYAEHHPRAVLTPRRRELIRSRIAEGYDPDRLVAAIEGNHADPHCNGENDRHRQYHDLELILRDAGHIEGYEAIWMSKQNGGARPAAERQVAVAVQRFRDLEAEQGRDAAEEWLDAVFTPDVVDRVLEVVAS